MAVSPLAFARENLLAYSIAINDAYQVAQHNRKIANLLQRVERGEVKRAMVFMPPRHGKSMLASENFPSWYLGRHPERYIITATYAQELADDFGRKVRNRLNDPLYQAIFPECVLRSDSAAARRFNTSAGGSYFAVGAGGPITGRGAHLLLVDDPLKNRAEAESETVRRHLKDWYTSTAYTRLMPGGAVVIIQTRWHEDDLAGWLLKEHAHEGWEVLSLPALDEHDAPLWPEAYDLQALERIKRAIGSRDWEALYQQRPSPAEGGLLKRGWWKTYREAPKAIAARADEVITSWDLAFKETKTSDFVVGQVWARIKADRYLLAQVRGRMDFPATVSAIKNLAAAWPEARTHLVEDKANGPAVMSTLGREIPGIIAVEPSGSKVARVNSVAPYVEAGNVYLPEGWEGLSEFIEEAAAFPNGVHDDQVDAMSQANQRLSKEDLYFA